MRLYLEALEVPPEEAPPEYAPEFIRIDVTGVDWRSVLEELKGVLNPEKRYQIRLHRCFHDENASKPCQMEALT